MLWSGFLQFPANERRVFRQFEDERSTSLVRPSVSTRKRPEAAVVELSDTLQESNRASNFGGTVTPRCRAAVKLIASSWREAVSIGKSPGKVPLSISTRSGPPPSTPTRSQSFHDRKPKGSALVCFTAKSDGRSIGSKAPSKHGEGR